MRLLLRLTLLLPALVLGAAGLLAVLALEDQPLVIDNARLSAEELARTERVLREHDPRRQPAGGYRTLTLSAEDLDALVGYLAQRFGGAATRVTLGPGEALVAGTRQLPENPVGRYLNLAATLRPRGTELALGDVTVGRLPLPDTLVAWVWGKLQAQLALDPGFRLARESVRDLRVGPDGVRIRYEWRPEILAAARDHLVPPAERERLAAYQQRLHRWRRSWRTSAGRRPRPTTLWRTTVPCSWCSQPTPSVKTSTCWHPMRHPLPRARPGWCCGAESTWPSTSLARPGSRPPRAARSLTPWACPRS